MPAARAIQYGLAAGLTAALLMLAASTGGLGGLILASMASLPLFAAGLGAGLVAGVVASVAGCAAATWGGGAAFGLMFLVPTALPALLLVWLALAKPVPPPASRLVLGLSGMGVAAFLVLFLAWFGHEGGIEGAIREAVATGLQQFATQSGMELPEPADVLASKLAFWGLGLWVALWQLNLAGNAMLAQGVLARFERTLRPAPPMASLELPPWVSALFGVALAGWCLGSGRIAYLGANLSEILAVPLVLGGLAVVHAAVRRHPARLIILVGVYVVSFAFLWPLALIVALGIVEEWAGLRQRIAQRGTKERKDG